jgi:UDP-2,3-diacylglucosamine hydrolase
MVYFISDVHLGFKPKKEDRKTEDLLISFLEKSATDADTLVIVGDLFDFWFDYRKVIPKNFYRTLTAIGKLVEKGIKIEYIIGNHDFGHFRFFKEEFGIEPHEKDIEREFQGKKFFLSHGDGKSNNDTGYRILKKILRCPLSQKLYRLLHPDAGIWLASGSSRKSRHYTDSKDYGNIDAMREYAFKKIDEGFDYVIMGHRHKMQYTSHEHGFYINLGSWMKDPFFGVFDGNTFELKSVKDLLSV